MDLQRAVLKTFHWATPRRGVLCLVKPMPFSSQRPVCEHTNDDLEYLETKQTIVTSVSFDRAFGLFFFPVSVHAITKVSAYMKARSWLLC